MKPHWIFAGIVWLCIGCGRPTPNASICQLSAADQAQLKSSIALADSLSKSHNISASDSVATQAIQILDGCQDRLWTYKCRFRLCMNAWMDERQEEAIQKCTRWTSEAESIPDSISGYYYSLLGWFHFERGEFENARPKLERAADLLEVAGRSQKLPAVYNNLAPCLIRLGDYEAAEHYLRAAMRLNSAKKDERKLAINHYNLGRNYNAQEQSEKAIACFERSAALQGEKDADYYEGMTKAFFNQKDYASAQAYAQKLLQMTQEEEGDIALALQWLGQIAAAQSKPEQAIAFYQRALRFWRTQQDTAHYDFGKTNIFLGDAQLASRKPLLALNAYQRALNGFIPDFKNGDIRSNPTAEQLPNEIWVMEALLNKADAWEQCFEQSAPKDSMLLKNALDCAEMASLAFLKMKNLYQEDASKLNLDRYGFMRFFEKSVKIAVRMADFTQNQAYARRAFAFAQRSKAGILRNALQERAALFSAHLPADSIRKMDRLQREMALSDRKLSTETDSLAADSLRDKRFYEKRKWLKMQRWASQALPAPEPVTDLSMEAIQQKLSQDALLIEYFVGADRLYTFAVSKTDFHFFQTPIPAHFEQDAALLLRALSDQNWVLDSMAQAEKTYLQQANAFYNLLLAPALQGSDKCKRLMLVPDGLLGRIPFSALLMQAYSGSWRDTGLPIVLKRYALSYLYSSALLRDMEALKKPEQGFGGFGADYRDPFTLSSLQQRDWENNPASMLAWAARGGPGVLDHADDEVDSLAQLTRGNKWLNTAATKNNFLRESPNCGILHFALHTVESPPNDLSGFYLLFSKINPQDDNFLSSNELAALDLNAELAVLSACYSGLGTFQQGEGMMNLGRAFALSGCPSTVVNLWQAHDEVSKNIMIAFYKNLKARDPKDIALQKAQLEYLKKTPAESAIPFFWANFVVLGDVAAVELPEEGWWRRLGSYASRWWLS